MLFNWYKGQHLIILYIFNTAYFFYIDQASTESPLNHSTAAPPLVHRTDQQANSEKEGQECIACFPGANYKGECALSSRPPDEEEDKPNQALSL